MAFSMHIHYYSLKIIDEYTSSNDCLNNSFDFDFKSQFPCIVNSVVLGVFINSVEYTKMKRSSKLCTLQVISVLFIKFKIYNFSIQLWVQKMHKE